MSKIRQELERKIARAVIKGLLDCGYRISVYNGEDDVTMTSQNLRQILGWMFETDEDTLFVEHWPAVAETGWERLGWVQFIYGNNGYDVIHDYTTNLKDALKKANELAEKYAP